MKSFRIIIFILCVVGFSILTFFCFIFRFAEEEGTLEESFYFLSGLYSILRFPTHSLFPATFSDNLPVFSIGLLINCLFYALITERIVFFIKKFRKSGTQL
ncbi:MAG: hypothetical protein K0S32_1346 [Bacteroidetes bacterium]|jgi:hypothetical protein|nr:hypothetical protein [Bacteroidota bacterium]